jgi:hypothetical protein
MTRTIYLRERAPATDWIGWGLGLIIVLVKEEKEKIN